MKKKMINFDFDIKIICDKCGKEQEIDKEQSNKNWTVYKNGLCKCGGEFEPKVISLSS